MTIFKGDKMINIMIDVLKEKDPAEWLAIKMVMSQEQIPKTTKEAVDIVKKLCNEAIEQSTQNIRAENERLKDAYRDVIKSLNDDNERIIDLVRCIDTLQGEKEKSSKKIVG